MVEVLIVVYKSPRQPLRKTKKHTGYGLFHMGRYKTLNQEKEASLSSAQYREKDKITGGFHGNGVEAYCLQQTSLHSAKFVILVHVLFKTASSWHIVWYSRSVVPRNNVFSVRLIFLNTVTAESGNGVEG